MITKVYNCQCTAVSDNNQRPVLHVSKSAPVNESMLDPKLLEKYINTKLPRLNFAGVRRQQCIPWLLSSRLRARCARTAPCMHACSPQQQLGFRTNIRHDENLASACSPRAQRTRPRLYRRLGRGKLWEIEERANCQGVGVLQYCVALAVILCEIVGTSFRER